MDKKGTLLLNINRNDCNPWTDSYWTTELKRKQVENHEKLLSARVCWRRKETRIKDKTLCSTRVLFNFSCDTNLFLIYKCQMFDYLTFSVSFSCSKVNVITKIYENVFYLQKCQ